MYVYLFTENKNNNPTSAQQLAAQQNFNNFQFNSVQLSAWRHWVKYGLMSKNVLHNAVMYSYYSLLLFFNICCYIRTCSQLYSLVMRSFALVCVVRRRKSVLCLPFAVDFNSFCLPSHSLTFSLYFCCNNGIFVNNFLCTACVEYYLIATLA